jgi:hypothetical protein
MQQSNKTDVRIVSVFRKSKLNDTEFLQEILDRVMVGSNAYMSKFTKLNLAPKKEEGEHEEEGEMVNVRYVSRGDCFMDHIGSSAVGEITLC